MYPIQCAGGFFNGLRNGKCVVVGVSAVVDDSSSDSRVGLIDDDGLPTNYPTGRILADTYDDQACIIDIKGVGGVDGNLEWWPGAGIPIRNGLSAIHMDNVKAGTVKVFMR